MQKIAIINRLMRDSVNTTPSDNKICFYCGMKDRGSLVRCMNCQLCFCNHRPNSRSESDILFHMYHSGHSLIATQLDTQRFLKCRICHDTDIFELYYKRTRRSRDRFFCARCVEHNRIPNVIPFIQSQRFPYWFASSFFQDNFERYITILTKAQKINIERRSLVQRSVIPCRISDFDSDDNFNLSLQPISNTFESIKQYVETFKPLVKAEASEEGQLRKMFNPNVRLQWRTNANGKIVSAKARPPRKEHFVIRFLVGHPVTLILRNEVKIEAKVHDVRRNWIILNFQEPAAPTTETIAIIELLAIGVSGRRMLEGLEAVEMKDPESSPLWALILNPQQNNAMDNQEEEKTEDRSTELESSLRQALGLNEHERFSNQQADNPVQRPNREAQNIFLGDDHMRLNDSQREAVQSALSDDPLTLIQGPPGTGKTQTLFTIIKNLLGKIPKKKHKILVCAPSNIAVDHLAEKLMRGNIEDVIRMYSKSRASSDEASEELLSISLHRQVQEQIRPYLGRDVNMRELRKEAEMEILKNTKIVCCTCVTSASGKLLELCKEGIKFKYVIIDEAAQALEPETLLPLLLGAKKVILAGDHQQLPPLVFSKAAANAHFAQSLFERLAKSIPPIVLLTQYRMHPQIARFPSKTFYEGRLINDNSVNNMDMINFPWHNPEHPKLFYHCQGYEEVPSHGESYFNREECRVVERLIEFIVRNNNRAIEIGVIVPYQGQKMYFEELRDQGRIPETVQIASIDGFQGREKELIIISCVRSNENRRVGFLENRRRLNVALTRAKKGLILCGDINVLRNSELWRDLLQNYHNDSLLVEGEIGQWERFPWNG